MTPSPDAARPEMSKLPLHRWESRTGVVDDDFAKKARVRKGSVFTVTDTGVGALVVERPWLRVIDHFPPTLQRQRFGT